MFRMAIMAMFEQNQRSPGAKHLGGGVFLRYAKGIEAKLSHLPDPRSNDDTIKQQEKDRRKEIPLFPLKG